MSTLSYLVSPEVAGGLGPNTVMDRTSHPPLVERLHYVFDGWLGSEIVESFPCFLVSEGLAQAIMSAGLTGVSFSDVEVAVDPQFKMFQPNVVSSLPNWLWLRPSHEDNECDFWVDEAARLWVSAEGYQLLNNFELSGTSFNSD